MNGNSGVAGKTNAPLAHMQSEAVERMRLHIGIHSGYRRIEKDARGRLIGTRRANGLLRHLPGFGKKIAAAGAAFDFLSSPLFHDLNRMEIILNTWDEHVHSVPKTLLQELIGDMREWLTRHRRKRPKKNKRLF
jgi:hypothetical protein